MGNHTPSPYLSPPPPSSLTTSNLPILYYAVVVVGTAAIVLALYNLVILRLCADFGTDRYPSRRMMIARRGSNWRCSNLNANWVSSFKYKKEAAGQNDYECAVCLSVLEEGEEVRQLPNCKHSFHAPCIDMWLCSHMNCPICRCPVEPPVLQQPAAVGQLEQSPSTVLQQQDIQRRAAAENSLNSSHGLQDVGMLV